MGSPISSVWLLWPFLEPGLPAALPPMSVAARAPDCSGPKPCNRGFVFFSYILSMSESCRLAFRTYPRATLLRKAVACLLSNPLAR